VILALAPHSVRLPFWLGLLALLCIIWRVLIFAGKLDYPSKPTRVFCAIVVLGLSFSQLSSVEVSLDVASSLLALGFIFKLIEMKTKRDIYIVLILCFIMSLVTFIYSQSVLTAMYTTFSIMVIVASMVSLNRSGNNQSASTTLTIAVRITAQSIPLMVVLFVLFPRIAPLWSVPTGTGQATTGVSDRMSPGDISSLGQSAELAFRVTFDDGNPPPLNQGLYWRGLVLEDFDGEAWNRQSGSVYGSAVARRDSQYQREGHVQASGSARQYNIILEPTMRPWLFGLHLSEPISPGISRGRNFELFSDNIVAQRKSYDLASYSSYQTDILLPDSVRRFTTRIPESGNHRSLELAANLRSSVDSDRDYAFTVMAMFQQQEFYYTLQPPLLGDNKIDDFLFNTRQGFCEHFASSFAFMMRAAGIPARVVLGYQGGEYNRFENYLMVYQYNAHAWTEVWLAGEGWVRFDPTSAVAPERILEGAQAAFSGQPGFATDTLFSLGRLGQLSLITTLRHRWDALEYSWNRNVVNYSEITQSQMFQNIFGQVTKLKIAILLALSSFFTVAIIGFMLFRNTEERETNFSETIYRSYCDELSRIGLPRLKGEGPVSYYRRVARAHPELQSELRTLNEHYLRWNYGRENRAIKVAEKKCRQEMQNAFAQVKARLATLSYS